MRRLMATASVPLVMLCTVVLAACGGGGAHAMPPLPGTQPSGPPISVAFSILVPRNVGSSRRRPQYVSTATQSAVVSYGSSRQVGNCAQSQCAITVSVNPGTVTFQVGLYDGANGAGNLLSTGSTTATIVSGQNNVVSLTFGGVIASLSLAIDTTNVVGGTAATIPVSVVAADAAGRIIVGQDTYTAPIVLSNSDPSGATSLSTTSVATPNTPVSITYNGNPAGVSSQLVARVASTSVAPAAAALTIAPKGNPGGSTVFSKVASQDGAAAIYSLADTGSVMTDAGAHAVNGTQGSSVKTGVPGITFNQASTIQFPGGAYNANAFDWTAPNAILQPANVSVEFSVKLNSVNNSGADEGLVSYAEGTPSGAGYAMLLRSPFDQIKFTLRLAGNPQYVTAFGTSHLAAGQTYHVIGTFDGNVAKLYINGALEASSTAVPGLAVYYPSTLQNGLAIGGERNSAAAQVDGTISDVALYPSAMSGGTVAQHYLASVNTPMITEVPSQSQAFVDSIGVSTHFTFIGSQWDTNFASIRTRLINSGIRHIRESLLDTPWKMYYVRLNDLAQAGITCDLVGHVGQGAPEILTISGRLPGTIDAFEGLNEPDLTGPGWQAAATAYQQVLFATTKSNPATAGIPVYGPSITSPQAAQSLGDLSAYLDDGNMHDYFGQDSPGSTGGGSYNPLWGYGGSIDAFLKWTAFVSATKPVVTTETGYGTDSSQVMHVDYATQAKYSTRTLFEQFNHGIRRTYLYELLDEPPQAGKNFNFNGLLDTSLNPKPSYLAITALTSVLADQGPPFSPIPLRYSLGGNLSNVHHMLMQRRDGTYQLAIWLEVSDWDAIANVPLHPAGQSVSITLGANPSAASFLSIDNSGQPQTQGVAFSNGTASLTVTDQISLLSFR